MNWKEIKERHPKSWRQIKNSRLFVDKIYFDDDGVVTIHSEWDRHLYDFFDENEIYVDVSAKCALDDSTWFIGYVWALEPDVNEYIEKEDQSRKVVENAAFLKAFEILEGKL